MGEVKILKWLLKKLKHRLPMFAFLILINMAGAALGIFFALGNKAVINGAVSGDMQAFLKGCCLQLSLIIGVLCCSTLNRYLTPKLMDELDRDWKKEFLHHLLQGEYAAVSQFHSGELINRLNNDIRVLNEGAVVLVLNAVSLVTRLVSATVTLLAMEPWFTMVLLVLGILAVVVTGAVRKKLKNLHKRVSEADGAALSFFQESLEKLMVVQAMNLGEQVDNRADKLLSERYRVQRIRRRISVASKSGVSLLFYFCTFGTLVWCGHGLLVGTMDFGTMTAMIQLVNQLQAPFVNLSGIIPNFTAMLAAAERLRELEELPKQEAASILDVQTYYNDISAFEVRSLTFAYEEENILEDVTFTLPKGVFAAITGLSGIGKSTLLKLMLGIYKPQQGGIYAVQGEKEECLGRKTRGLIAYVPQGNFLFSGTVRENLLMIAPEADEEALSKAVYVSAMDQFLDQLPDGLDTVIGEHGEGLSEGQAQRVSIARAILSGAPVLLLDEATSALDGETETLVLQRICALKDRTCIAVTHRPAALEQADYQLLVKERNIQSIALRAQCSGKELL